MPRVESESRELVVRLHLEGKTNGQIRLATGLSRGTIGGHIGRWRKENRGGAVNRDFSKTQTADTLRKSAPSYDKEREQENRHRQADKDFVRLVALAILRGDNLPAGEPKPLQLMG